MTECPNMRYGLSGAGLVSLGDTLLLTGGGLLGLLLPNTTRQKLLAG